LDPLAPLSWRRLTLWPDGLGSALNHALHTDPAQAATLTEIATNDVLPAFAVLRPGRSDSVAVEVASRSIREALGARQLEQGMLRLNYALNPLAPCESPLLASRWVVRLGDLLPALEIAATGPLRATLPPIDRHVVAFIGMRRDDRTPADLGRLASLATPGDPMSQLRLLARLQQYTHPEKLPALTAWMAELINPATAKFHSHSRRSKLAERLAELAPGGMLPALVALLDDPQKLFSDQGGYEAAIARGAQIDAELEAIGSTNPPRRIAAAKTAHDVTNGISLAVCGLALAAAAFL
jgi:eukaryotic-like serine/threonine-protein kinase